MERDLRYLLQTGYQKGASHVNTSFRFDVVSRVGNASKSLYSTVYAIARCKNRSVIIFLGSLDFLVENDTLIMEGTDSPQSLFVTFFEDGVAQESNETFTINLEPIFADLENLPNGEAVFFMRAITMTIVDNDRTYS
jgi:hypothetical protein